MEPGRFERVSWDDAFSFIAEKLTAIKEKWGPEALVFLTHHDPNSAFMVSMLANLYGTPNISLGHVMGCEADRRVATLTLFGDIFPMHDFENSRYVMLWGMNIFGANQGLFESRGLANAKSRDCKLVVVDPSFTETAQKADEWVPIRPGTDGALALAMLRVIVDEDLFDRDFVNAHCSGFEGFRDHLRERGYTAGVGGADHRCSRRYRHGVSRASSPPPSPRWRRCSGGRATTPTGPTRAAPSTCSTW